MNTEGWKYQLGDKVKKKKGSNWHGVVCGFYVNPPFTERGYNVRSAFEEGSVQIYPEDALEFWEVIRP